MLYFDWLQKNNPAGKPDRFPALKNRFETTVPGLYCIGDLTGIPLIKLAAESGFEFMEKLSHDESFIKERRAASAEMYDLIILGAGPSGVSASLHAVASGYKHLVIESSRMFNTVHNFPAGKPIYVTPAEPPLKSALKFGDGTKESLLRELAEDLKEKSLPIHENETARRITQNGSSFTVQTSKASYPALRVVVAIGKTGNARTLGVPGEKLPKVFTRLIDPGEFYDKDILVVGGGDSAVEAAVALAHAGNRVTLSYRKSYLGRPKEKNLENFELLAAKGSIVPLFDSTVKEFRPDDVVLNGPQAQKTLPNQAVFVLIGTEIPLEFFKRSGIRIEGEKHFSDRVKFLALLLFALALYFGKNAPITPAADLHGFLRIPRLLFGESWPKMTSGLLAWTSLFGLAACAAYLAGHFLKNKKQYFTSAWNSFKYGYYLLIMLLFPSLYVAYKIVRQRPVFGDMGDWYTVFYSLTIVIFGLRRIAVKPTGYIKRQTITLMAVQVVPLFILPLFVFPLLGAHGLLGGWIMRNVFPGGSYWRSFGLVLAWPLFIHNLATGQPTMFWLTAGIAQTFVIIPYIVYRWGKGAYCGWICSCGALAETLGDEYRTNAPHGPSAKKGENSGQVVLWFALAVTLLALFAGQRNLPFSKLASDIYGMVVDTIFAGVLGLGVYFFMSGRLWCRMLCPLAALMHIYARFTVYRIFANKKRCISCNICTKVCHMGIDVMNYANKGIPLNDVECVRCSACVVACPLQVLTFGRVDKIDSNNERYKTQPPPLTRGWAGGLPKKQIEMLLQLEAEKR
ncbi:MAG: NAD(P)-binding domain-containing protein [Chitinivibrionales bacterium]|nr:NAD(P)-binding domain-containing protein [Chitinivibrionales bacterium]